jgi:hypothetical protein
VPPRIFFQDMCFLRFAPAGVDGDGERIAAPGCPGLFET